MVKIQKSYMAKSEPVYGWHFLAAPGRLRDRSTSAKPGEYEVYEGKLEICSGGLHFSRRPLDAVRYAPGSWVRYVECYELGEQWFDKGVCRVRGVVWEGDASEILHEFACRIAEKVLNRIEMNRGKVAPSSWAVIEAKRRWLRGEITSEELAAAREASWDPIRSVVGMTAWASAGTAAAMAAAYGAALWGGTVNDANQLLLEMLCELGDCVKTSANP